MEKEIKRDIDELKAAKDIVDMINHMLTTGKDIYQACSAAGISISEYARLKKLV